MMNIIKLILFSLVNAAGYFTISTIATLAIKLDVFPQMPPGVHMENFKLALFGIGMWVWIGCALVSIGYFFVSDKYKNWLLLAPMYGPAIYSTIVILYFNYFYSVA